MIDNPFLYISIGLAMYAIGQWLEAQSLREEIQVLKQSVEYLEAVLEDSQE